MISVEEAFRILRNVALALPVERVQLPAAQGRFLSAPAIAPHDHPLFDMSAVDGYALVHAPEKQHKVSGEVPAGSTHAALRPGEAVRIFTGAAVPSGADTVVMQERVERIGENITYSDPGLRVGGNIRKRAEQVEKGDVLMQPGDPVNAAAIGLLASVGLAEVEVHAVPRVLVIVTGNEFIAGDDPTAGRIFSSNDKMLLAALSDRNVTVDLAHAADDRELLARKIEQGLLSHDVLITTGGVSVGDHDLVEEVVRSIGADIKFHGVAQKPGKPMLFATLNGRAIFGLPGNPRAALILGWVYVLPYLRALQGAQEQWEPWPTLPIAADLAVVGGRAEFRAARVANGQVEMRADEGSHMLRSLIDADALAYLPADRRQWSAGDHVALIMIPR